MSSYPTAADSCTEYTRLSRFSLAGAANLTVSLRCIDFDVCVAGRSRSESCGDARQEMGIGLDPDYSKFG